MREGKGNGEGGGKKEGIEMREGELSHFITSGYRGRHGEWSLCILNQQMGGCNLKAACEAHRFTTEGRESQRAEYGAGTLWIQVNLKT